MTHPWFGDKPFLTSSAFSTMCFLDRWARGMGGHWRDYVERFIERKQKQGVAALRVFDETSDWKGTKGFFTDARATSRRMWDYGALRQQHRPHGITAHHQTMLFELLRLSRKHDMRVELVVDATLKHSPGVGWDVIGQCIKKVAKFLNHVHISEWDPEGEDRMGSPDPAVNERLRKAFDDVKGPLNHLIAIETHNEADAHARGAWEVDGHSKESAFKEVNAQLQRMRRQDHFPGVATWVSEGGEDGQGRDVFDYDISLPDCIAVHPSRPNMEIGDRFESVINGSKRHGIPVYANEIIHYIDPSLWWTVEQGWFRPGSSTKDARKRAFFILGMMDLGFYVCDHSLVGMADGILFDDAGNPTEMPLDEFEKRLGSTVDPPAPVPPPRQYRYATVIYLAYRQILGREPDEGGLSSYNGQMLSGLTEAEMRQSLIESAEYVDKNPEEA